MQGEGDGPAANVSLTDTLDQVDCLGCKKPSAHKDHDIFYAKILLVAHHLH